MSLFSVEHGMIRHYREVFSAGLALVQLDMTPDRIDKILQRMADAHRNDPEWGRHFAGSPA